MKTLSKQFLGKLFLALGLLAGSGAALADHDHDRGHDRGDRHGRDDRGWGRGDRDRRDWDRRDHWRGPDRHWRDDRRWDYGHYRPHPHRWARGDRYYGPTYVVRDYGYYRLRPPPYGYHWVRDDSSYLLVSMGSGVILDMVIR